MRVERLPGRCRTIRVPPAWLGRTLALATGKQGVLLLTLEFKDHEPARNFRRAAILSKQDGLPPRECDHVLGICKFADRSRIPFRDTVEDGFRLRRLGNKQ